MPMQVAWRTGLGRSTLQRLPRCRNQVAESVPQLYDALETSLGKRDAVGTVRLAVAWWNAFDDRGALLRCAFESLVDRGRDERAEELGLQWVRYALRVGDLLLAADALHHLERLRVDTREWWTRLTARWTDGSERAAASRPSVGLASLAAGVGADLDEVLDLLLAQLGRESTEERVLLRVPLGDALDADAVAMLRETRPRAVPQGAPLLGPSDAAAWILSGAYRTERGTVVAKPGTLLLAERSEDPRLAASPARLLTLSTSAFARWRDDERVSEFLVQSTRRAAAVRSLRNCGFYHALSPGARARFLAAAEGSVHSPGTVVEPGAPMPGLLVLVQGQAEIVDRDGRVQVNVTRLLPGDVAGEHEVVSRTPAATGLVVTSAAAFLSIPMRVARALCADEPAAREWLVALIAKRAEEFDRLDTGEVVLLDE